MTTGLNYNELLEWDKNDLIDHVLSLQYIINYNYENRTR